MTHYPAITNNLSHMFKDFPRISEMKWRKDLSFHFLHGGRDEGHIKSVPAFHIEEMIFISWAGLQGNCIQAVLRFKPVMNSLIRISLLWTVQLLTQG